MATTPVPSPVRIGILGGGGIATAHLNAYATLADLRPLPLLLLPPGPPMAPPPVPSPVRIGILGGGGIATAHLNAYATVADRAKVTAIADVDAEALSRREAETGATGYADFKEL